MPEKVILKQKKKIMLEKSRIDYILIKKPKKAQLLVSCISEVSNLFFSYHAKIDYLTICYEL